MKRLIAIHLVLFGVLCQSTFAAVPAASVTSMLITLYGMYVTADPTCQTGLVATIPLAASPTQFNLAQSPVLGSGPISSSINCVIFVMQNHFQGAIAAGNYSNDNGVDDSVCNGGGLLPAHNGICSADGGGTAGWPTQISTDATAVSLSLYPAGGCPASPTGSEVIPVYLSTYATCTSECNAFTPPTAANDGAHGLQLTAPSTAGDFKFVVNPTGSFGNQSGSCGDIGPPQFSFVAK